MVADAQFRGVSLAFKFEGRNFMASKLVPRAESMIHIALSAVIGVKKHVQGVEVTQTATPTLIDLAPAVWNFRYLQVLVHNLDISICGLT